MKKNSEPTAGKALKLICVIMALICIILPVASCQNNTQSEDTGKESGEVSESLRETDSETDGQPIESATEALPTEVILFDNGVSEYSLIRPEKASNEFRLLAIEFSKKLIALSSDQKFEYRDDYIHDKNPVRDFEILLGETNRQESTDVYDELSKIEGNCFIIRVINYKVVIAATNVFMMANAVEYFETNCLKADSNGKISLPLDFNYISEIKNDQPATIINSIKGQAVATGELIYTQNNDGNFKVGQGACTDGKYMYLIIENQNLGAGKNHNKDFHTCKIFKVEIATKKLIKVSEPLWIDHGNDCEYNPLTNRIVVTHNAPDRHRVSYINADTLEMVETVSISAFEMYGIAYNKARDRYVIALSHGYNFAIVDTNFKLKKYHMGVDTGNVKQGIDADDDYIYMLQFNKNVIVVYDWDGNYVRQIELSGFSNEPEALFHIGSQLYMTCYRSGGKGVSVYKLNLSEAK